VKKLTAYVVLVVLIYLVHLAMVKWITDAYWFSIGSGLLFFLFFAWFVSKIEAKELARMPVIGRFIHPKKNPVPPSRPE
jgi:ABC-type nickel/cobalt efflux system permease component RcnA